ncbi:MAG: hypothetical protein IIW75_04635 [Bacteroidaceae bacterium]|nr:hypothetical protein [Bacteroidaceae bacterium]
MNDVTIEFFRGNKQEIENEKRRKSALMSCFPKTLGTIDKTRYILVDDDRPNWENHYDKMNFGIPVSTLIYNKPTVDARRKQSQSEKPKKQQDNTVASISNLENNIQTINFDNRKESTTKKEGKQKTKGTESLFGFESITKDGANNPFNFNTQCGELKTTKVNTPRTACVGNDSGGLVNRNRRSYADSLKTASINYNTNTVSNNATITKPEIKPGLYGWKPEKDYSKELNKLKSQLPPIAASILNNSGTEIIVLKNLHSVDENGDVTPRIGRYYAGKNKVYLDSEHVNDYTLLSEAIHAVQDYLGMTGSGKSNLEFQEHVIKDLYFKQQYTRTGDYKDYQNHSTSTEDEYDKFITSLFDENNVLDLNKFLSNINKFIVYFQNNYEQSNSYQTQAVKKFNYNWIKLLHIFGIEYKY